MSFLTPTMVINNESTINAKNLIKMDQIYEKREVVAEWRVQLEDEVYKIEFEHGIANGKRVLWINEKV